MYYFARKERALPPSIRNAGGTCAAGIMERKESRHEVKGIKRIDSTEEETQKRLSTSILELIYLTKAKNNNEISFSEWFAKSLEWARGVVEEYEQKDSDKEK